MIEYIQIGSFVAAILGFLGMLCALAYSAFKGD